MFVAPERKSFYSYDFAELHRLCDGASYLFNWHYKKNRRDECRHHNLSKKAKAFLADMNWQVPAIARVNQSPDKTVKFLFAMEDGAQVETVLIPFQGKYTVCLSSQVGCAMNCAFCFTGRQGFKRHLKTEEIVGQLVEAKRWLSTHRPDDDRLLNIVFMGQGEPLHNFDSVRQATKIFLSQHGLSFAAHKITISTAGYLPGLERWREEMPDVNIAVSLHATDHERRNELVPINRRFGFERVMALADAIPKGDKRFVTYEYVMIDGFNDRDSDAQVLGRMLKGRKAFINLIPFNPFPGSSYRRSPTERIIRFKAILDDFHIPTTIRSTKGDEILAACGQLNSAQKALAVEGFPS